MKKTKSLIIGFCKCADCGWSSGKFNWHTYFKCENCGSKKYIKEREIKDERNQDETNGQEEKTGFGLHSACYANTFYPDNPVSSYQ